MDENTDKWHVRGKDDNPPLNVPVLCRLTLTSRAYEPYRGLGERYKYGVHWIMEDGKWSITEEVFKITHWKYIVFDGKIAGENERKFI